MISSRERDEQEARNSRQVYKWVEHLARHPEIPIDLNLICHLNKLTLQGTDADYWAGRLRAKVDWQEPEEWGRPRALIGNVDYPGLAVRDVETGETIVSFAPTSQVKPLLDSLLVWLDSPQAQASHPVVRAATFHQRFTAIHPFRDGNGRTCRALVNLILMREGYSVELLALQGILDQRRDGYIAALAAADQGNVKDWINFFVRAVRDAVNEVDNQSE